jgi:recombination protein RecA
MKKTVEKTGKLSVKDLQSLLNKKAGMNIVHNLNEENPTEVKQWIPTGSTWLDSIICRGQKAGLPVGKIIELAGEEATGKSYMAAQIAVNAQKMGITPVYLDSESSIDPKFLGKMGCDLENLLYVQAVSVEKTLELIEDLLKTTDQQFLFIWDSMALTPTTSDIEGDFNPQSSMAVKPRILSKGLSKLIIPIAESQSTLLILNQLKLNIGAEGNPKYLTQSQKFFTPGGKALAYAYSLRIWLTGSKAKDSFVTDDKGFRVGSLVKARLEKSRFGSQGRSCEFKILWGDRTGVLDDESLFEAIKSSPHFTVGSWCTLRHTDGEEEKFRSADWLDKMKNEKFRNRIMEIIDEEVIRKFDERTGEANYFYDNEGQNEEGSRLEF